MTLRLASVVFAAVTVLGGPVEGPPEGQRPPFLVAFDAKTGETRWRVSPGDRPGFLAVGHAFGDLVYGEQIRCGVNLKPSLIAFDTDTGEQRWHAPIGDDGLSTGMGKGAVVVVDRDGALRGLDPKTGDVRWKRDLDGFAPTGGNRDLVLVGRIGSPEDADGAVRAIDRRTGRTRWEFAFTGIAGNPVADDDTVVLASGPLPSPATTPNFTVYVIDANTGTPTSEFAVPGIPDWIDVTGSVVAVFSSPGNAVNGYDGATGEHLWAAAGAPARVPLALAGAFLVRNPPAFVVLDARTGGALTTMATDTLGDFDADDKRLVVAETLDRKQWTVRTMDIHTGDVLWQRKMDAVYVDVALSRDTVYASGGCATAP